MSDVFDDEMSLSGRCVSRIDTVDKGNGSWLNGCVVTPHGIVDVYAQGDHNHVRHSRLDFAFRGRLYMRNFNGIRYSKRGLVKKAREFVEEITKGDAHDA